MGYGINKEEVLQLLHLEESILYSRATAIAATHPRLLKSAPLILTGNCTTRPICRHCKWEHFKAIKKNAFILDSSPQEVIEQAQSLESCGIDRVFFATGWLGYRFPLRFLATIEAVREAAPSLELFGLFGALDRRSHFDLASAGLDGMLTGLESPCELVYRRFRPGGDSLNDRLRSLEYCAESGLAIWTGFLVGLGETDEDVAHGIELIARFTPQSVSILPFVPFPDTEMADHPLCDMHRLARINAVARISLPETKYFFCDRIEGFGDTYAKRIGLNGVYEVSRQTN